MISRAAEAITRLTRAGGVGSRGGGLASQRAGHGDAGALKRSESERLVDGNADESQAEHSPNQVARGAHLPKSTTGINSDGRCCRERR